MTIDTSKLTANWKSSAIGVCVLLLASLHSVKFDAAGHLSMTARDWFSVAIGFAGACVGVAMKDVQS